ncbi:hypothetical protein E2562_004055 [Oryza meyeriana var. granulata]|uniref:SANT domain-containing protein n=1 Tax=Oryza meyeriana var. granulata TaxID=110450 RepID=A0A6G1BJC1_9ORYZ|nr:hypothetical protein E2562_004055 [Oryza meyeriana var. granulata]
MAPPRPVMEPLENEDGDGHQSDAIDDDSPPRICIGKAYQAEIPNLLATEDERRQYMSNTPDSCMTLGYDCPIPVMWVSPSKFNKKEEEIQMQLSSETKATASSRDGDSQMTLICPISNNTSEHCSMYQDPHQDLPVDQIVSDSHQAHDDKLAPCSTQGLNFTDKAMKDQGEIEQFIPVPNSSNSFWSDQEAELFLLGLYIFGKNLHQLSRFVGSKTVGDVLSYYYGKFYKREAYKRWSDCRKARIRRCILGERIFIGWRRQELISRLKSKILQEAHDLLDEMFKSFNDGQTSLVDFVFDLKSVVGIEAFVEAVAIEKEKVKLPSTSSKPTAIDVGGTIQSKSLASCSAKEKPCKQIKDASNSRANDRSNEKTNVAKLKEKPSGRKVDTLAAVHSKITAEDTQPAKGAAQSSDLVNQAKLETQQDDKTITSAHTPSSDNHGSIVKNNEAPSGSYTETAHDASEATRGGPVSPQPDLQASSQAMNPRRQGTRVRPPTTRALEAVAFGLLGGGKRKADPRNPAGTSRPRQRSRKSTKETASVSTSSDTEKSSMDSGARQ